MSDTQFEILRFRTLKFSFELLNQKSDKTESDMAEIDRIRGKLNDRAAKLVKTTSYSDAFNWLCSQNMCARQNCDCKKGPVIVPECFTKIKSIDNYDDPKPVPKPRFPTKAQIDRAMKPLDSLVGLGAVKSQIKQIIKTAIVDQKRSAVGLPIHAPSLHMVFTGNPGTGKTECARLIAGILKDIGILNSGRFVEVDRGDLIGRYVGHTAPLVKEKIEEALGGVLFIDEAYALNDGSYSSYGDEALATLVKAMEDHRDNLIVIMAGYKDEMDWLIKRNPGLRSRLPHMINFEDYSIPEMADIFEIFCKNSGYVLSPLSKEKLYAGFKFMPESKKSAFDNARGVRNFFEAVIRNQSQRIFDKNIKTKKNLSLILPEDIRFDYHVQSDKIAFI